jgi:hypothetical protein
MRAMDSNFEPRHPWLYKQPVAVSYTPVRRINSVLSPAPENKMPKRKQIPKFRSEKHELKFWAKNDSTDFIDWRSGQQRKFPNLKPSLRTISLRLPVSRI